MSVRGPSGQRLRRPRHAKWHGGPTGFAGESRCVGTSVRVSAKWLMAEWPPAGENPADEKDLRNAGVSLVER